MSQIRRDPNDKILLDGVEPVTAEFLIKQGHRHRDCPDYVAVSVFSGRTMQAALSGRDTQIPVAVVACRCGCVVAIPLGVG